MANILNSILVLRMTFTRIFKADAFLEYLVNSINVGSASVLYANPLISTAFYTQGRNAASALQTAMDNFHLRPTKTNRGIIKNKINAGKRWLHKYSDKVEVIANDDANRMTPAEASTNIMLSNLTPRKLIKNKKGKPPTPKITGVKLGAGEVDARIHNGKDYKPMVTHFILVERGMGAVLTLANGTLTIKFKKEGQILFKTAHGKGRLVHFKGVGGIKGYELYAYSQHSNKECSDLSPVFIVGFITVEA